MICSFDPCPFTPHTAGALHKLHKSRVITPTGGQEQRWEEVGGHGGGVNRSTRQHVVLPDTFGQDKGSKAEMNNEW